ncbi:DUF262 domain-containing protein [Burkholderia sp. Bp8963]|uniref:DUF262 domain-containing protein n=1 Tax=Burkholderia sp. Bp8963 TaxID=2184547 RepID=UPI000F5A0430|nr:DUF262 domain-containing protein [Burkholderia sp. Bp8963]RQS60666.1 DUF262 domain-containing protein [Burkholderia sp. Bp8963]
MTAFTSTIAPASGGQSYILDHKTVGAIRGHFFVPSYQRGYRWGPSDVTRLLDDIWASGGKSYSLQPIVVKLHRDAEKPEKQQWELIDGQQRLTTLYLIFRYMKKDAKQGFGAPYTILYQTRPGSQEYLETLEEAIHCTNIDYFHLYKAYQAIDTWFKRHGDIYALNHAAGKIHSYLFDSVRVIWYEAPIHVAAIPLFTRLNVGRIPLNDAELVKAALLSKARSVSSDRAHEIAAQWDGIERDLHHPDIWSFIAGPQSGTDDERYPTRISLLLDTLADQQPRDNDADERHQTFEALQGLIEKDFSGFWREVVALHAQILGWHDVPGAYNRIGYLVATGAKIGDVVTAAKGKRKSEFERYLTSSITNHLGVRDDDLEELDYEEKKRGYPKLLDLLLLMNVETCSRAGLRFPFVHHVGQRWSLEHIHAQNADALNKADQWRTWLTTHERAIDALDAQHVSHVQLKTDIQAAISEMDNSKSGGFTGERFNALSMRILQLLNTDTLADHSIRNLALLSSSDNSRLNSSVFEVKRQMILELDRAGKYVPPCTRNVFLKYYAAADAQQPHFWSEKDKTSYLDAIRDLLKSYLS